MTKENMGVTPDYLRNSGITPPEQPKPKNCEDIGFEHLWENIIPDTYVYPSPPQPQVRRCRNCYREQVRTVKQPEIVEWVDRTPQVINMRSLQMPATGTVQLNQPTLEVNKKSHHYTEDEL